MREIESPRLLYAKGVLFLGLGVTAAALLLVEHPTLKTALLLGLAVWAFARAYYFAFYVIEHYIDGEFKYDGLISFLLHHRRGRRKARGERPVEGD